MKPNVNELSILDHQEVTISSSSSSSDSDSKNSDDRENEDPQKTMFKKIRRNTKSPAVSKLRLKH